MKKQLFLAALVSFGLAYAPAAMAQATNMQKPAMSEPMMDKKPDPMAKPAADKMKPSDGMMDKKDTMSSDKMKK